MITHSYSHQQLVEAGKFSQIDLEKISLYRGTHKRLGFAYQLAYIRIFNYFPQQKPFEILEEVIKFIALQLGVNHELIQAYSKHRQHIARHQDHIRAYLNLRLFDSKAQQELCDFLFSEAQRIEQITLLLSESHQFLKNTSTIQPSDDTLLRLISTQREKAREFIFTKLASLLNESMKKFGRAVKSG